jgi:hypothetical protein
MRLVCSTLVIVAMASFVSADEKHTEKSGAEQTKAAATKGETAAKAPAAQEMTYTGEVLDLTCYASHPETGSGPAHATCAKSCLEKGLPAGLLIGDQVYLVVMKDHTAPTKALAPHAGQKITVKGTVKEVGGMRVLEVAQIVPAPEAGKS